jgi:hypothetical protein
MAFVCQVSRVLDGDTSIVAQPGIQSGISGGTHFLSPVDLQYYLRRWTQLGTRGHCKQLPGLENDDAILTPVAQRSTFITRSPLDDAADFRAYALMLHCDELSLYFAFLPNIQRCSFSTSAAWISQSGRNVPWRSFRITAWPPGRSSSGPRHHHALPSTW